MHSVSSQLKSDLVASQLLKSLAPGLSSLSNGGRFGKESVSLEASSLGDADEKKAIVLSLIKDTSPQGLKHGGRSQIVTKELKVDIVRSATYSNASIGPVSCEECGWKGVQDLAILSTPSYVNNPDQVLCSWCDRGMDTATIRTQTVL